MLIEQAMDIARSGHVPSVAEVAMRADVSRATAYRYFPSRSKLVAAMVHHSLGPVRGWRSASKDGRARVADLFEQTFPRLKEYEPQLRAALIVALEHQLQERAGLLEEEPYRRGYRIGTLEHAVEPLKATLGPKAAHRLVMALAMVYGIEPYVIWKDIFGANDREVESLARWMAKVLVEAALRDARKTEDPGEPTPSPRPSRRRSNALGLAARRTPR